MIEYQATTPPSCRPPGPGRSSIRPRTAAPGAPGGPPRSSRATGRRRTRSARGRRRCAVTRPGPQPRSATGPAPSARTSSANAAEHRPVQRLGREFGAQQLGVVDGDGVVGGPGGAQRSWVRSWPGRLIRPVPGRPPGGPPPAAVAEIRCLAGRVGDRVPRPDPGGSRAGIDEQARMGTAVTQQLVRPAEIEVADPPSLWRSRNFLLLWSGQTRQRAGHPDLRRRGPAARRHRPRRQRLPDLAADLLAWLPYLLFSLPAGMLADRVDQRRLMIACDLGRMALMLSLPLVALVGAADAVVPVRRRRALRRPHRAVHRGLQEHAAPPGGGGSARRRQRASWR